MRIIENIPLDYFAMPNFYLSFDPFPIDPHVPKRKVYPRNPFPIDPNAPLNVLDKYMQIIEDMNLEPRFEEFVLIVPAHQYKEYYYWFYKPKNTPL